MHREFDPDEEFVLSDARGDCIAPNGQPWEMPQFTAEEAYAIGAIAAKLIESGEWEEIEARIIAKQTGAKE